MSTSHVHIAHEPPLNETNEVILNKRKVVFIAENDVSKQYHKAQMIAIRQKQNEMIANWQKTKHQIQTPSTMNVGLFSPNSTLNMSNMHANRYHNHLATSVEDVNISLQHGNEMDRYQNYKQSNTAGLIEEVPPHLDPNNQYNTNNMNVINQNQNQTQIHHSNNSSFNDDEQGNLLKKRLNINNNNNNLHLNASTLANMQHSKSMNNIPNAANNSNIIPANHRYVSYNASNAQDNSNSSNSNNNNNNNNNEYPRDGKQEISTSEELSASRDNHNHGQSSNNQSNLINPSNYPLQAPNASNITPVTSQTYETLINKNEGIIIVCKADDV